MCTVERQLKDLAWEPSLYARLLACIEEGHQAVQTHGASVSYMVFDFDETCIMGDVEEHLTFYLIDQLAFKLSPEDFASMIGSCRLDLDAPLEENQASLRELVADLSSLYEDLYQSTKAFQDAELVAQAKTSPSFQSFQAKAIYYYFYVHDRDNFQVGQIWPTYWFAGYSLKEFQVLVQEMLDQVQGQPRQEVVFHTHPQLPGNTGPLSVSWLKGLGFPAEMLDLFEVLQANQIQAYVVSASPQILVQWVAEHSPLQIEREAIHGMPVAIQDGLLCGKIQADQMITKGSGKTRFIKTKLSPHHQNRPPLAIFGDSMGDYDMLTDFPRPSLAIIFDRDLQGPIQALKERAQNVTGQDPRTFVQGRNDSRMIFNSQTKSNTFYKQSE